MTEKFLFLFLTNKNSDYLCVKSNIMFVLIDLLFSLLFKLSNV